jgi:hypothetical protein
VRPPLDLIMRMIPIEWMEGLCPEVCECMSRLLSEDEWKKNRGMSLTALDFPDD